MTELKATAWIRELSEKCLANQASAIEGLAAAYLKETGLQPSEVMLVEQVDGNKVKWWFEKRDKPTPG